MSQVEALLLGLIHDGVRISINGENLKIDSPSGILTPKTKQLIRVLKPGILQLLQKHGSYEKYYNEYVDTYNQKLEKVLQDESMLEEFNVLLSERIAIIEIDGNLSRPEAEAIATEVENVRQTVLSL